MAVLRFCDRLPLLSLLCCGGFAKPLLFLDIDVEPCGGQKKGGILDYIILGQPSVNSASRPVSEFSCFEAMEMLEVIKTAAHDT